MTGGRGHIITFTGITGQLREHYKSVVAGLGACYSGSLQAGYTTHLVVAGEVEQLRASAKVHLAQATSIPLVSLHWLDDSQADGLLLDHESYLVGLDSPQLAQLLTKESVSGLCVPSLEKLRRHAGAAAAGEFLDLSLGPGSTLHNMASPSLPNRKPILQHEAVPDLPRSPLQDRNSPPLNLSMRLSGACNAADLSIIVLPKSQTWDGLDRSFHPTEILHLPTSFPAAHCGAAPCSNEQRLCASRKRSRAGTATGGRHDVQGANFPHPHTVAPCGSGSASGSTQAAKASACSVRAVDLQVNDCVAHNVLHGQPCCRSLGPSGGVGNAAALEWQRTAGSRGTEAPDPPRDPPEAMLGNMLSGAANQAAREDNSGLGSNLFMKRATANVTVRRGRRPRRQRATAAGVGIEPSKLTLPEPAWEPRSGSLRGDASRCEAEQAADECAHRNAEGVSPGGPAACTSPIALASGWQPLPAIVVTDTGGGSLPCVSEPGPTDFPDPAGEVYLNGGLLRYKPTTKVHLGENLASPPSHSTACSVKHYHSLRSLQGVTFYRSATLELADGRKLLYQAGEAAHGVKMVYNLQPDGSEQHAFALVLSIYKLSGSNDVYFEHRYLLTAADLEERPAWKSFLKETVIRQDELLLTLGSYHSPMALCVDEFGMAYTGHAQLKSNPLPSAAGQYLPLLECRRGFDTERGRGVSLRKALRDLH